MVAQRGTLRDTEHGRLSVWSCAITATSTRLPVCTVEQLTLETIYRSR